MNLLNLSETFTLTPTFNGLLSEFIDAGWRIIETKKERIETGANTFEDRVTFFLGATPGVEVPPEATKVIKATLAALKN